MINIIQFQATIGQYTITVVMEKILKNCDLVLKDANVKKKNADNIVKSHKCNQCDFASSFIGALKTHLKMHSGEKPNKCNQCDYATSQTGNLRSHLKKHSGERSNKCYQCDFASSHARSLKAHLKMHEGENAINVTMHPLMQAI